mgnify:CR=1 FL=1
MNNIVVNFDFHNMTASLEYLGNLITKEINICEINNYTKMATISYSFNDDHKWSFNWSVWNNREQFFEFNQYKREDIRKDPWKTLGKWSYISTPQIGTVQKSNVYRMTYKDHLFPKVTDIKFTIKGNDYGDWDNTIFVDGYYY